MNRKYFRRFILVLFLVLGLLILVLNSKRDTLETMITFIEPKGRFSILLPEKPKITTNKDTEEFTAKSGYTQFIVRLVPIKNPIEKQLDEELQNIMKKTGGLAKLVYKDVHTDSTGMNYVDYKFMDLDKTWQGRMFVTQKTLYILLEVSEIKNHNDSRFNNFVSSFQLE